LYDKDLVLWTQLLAESLNAWMLDELRARGHAELRYAHGFLFQQLVEGPRAVGEVAADLGVTSQAVSKTARELEGLGYVRREPDPADARAVRVVSTARGRREFRQRKERFARALERLSDELSEIERRQLADALETLGRLFAEPAQAGAAAGPPKS
jgi:DNA-binding MarR family transcriptional regulator